MVNGAGQIPEPHKSQLAPKITRTPAQKVAFKPAPKVELKAGHDEVTLSPKAKAVSAVTSQVKQVHEVRHDRVNEIKSKIAKAGNSGAQNARIAEKLLTEH